MAGEMDRLSDYIRDEVGYEGELSPDIDLLDARILDSFSVVEMAAYIQSNFDVELEAEDLTRDNFASLTTMITLIEKRSSR
jgi:acyl carrier protein